MALPTMRPQWTKTFKTPIELSKESIQKQDYYKSRWREHDRFFQNNEILAQKQNTWTSKKSFKKSMRAIDRMFSEEEAKEKLELLEIRRKKLQKLLANENKKYEDELRSLRIHLGNRDFMSMQNRLSEMHAEKEEQRKLVAEEKLYEHWRKNEPRLRQVESDRHRKNVVKKWGSQISEKEEAMISARSTEKRLDDFIESENVRAIEKQKEEEQKKQIENKRIADDLRLQMLELNNREEESRKLKEEEEKLQKHTRLLQQAEEKRKHYIEQKKKQDLGRVLIRQYKHQLKRKSKAVQESLEFDLQILKDIAEKKEQEQQIEIERKEKMKADAEYMLQVITEQLRLEKMREAEVDLLYQEEATRQWRKRESEWERETLAREKLMKAVLDERQEQINEKMKQIHLQKKASIEERERLIEQMEEHQRLTHREKIDAEYQTKQRQEEISEQITARETERERRKRQELQILEEERKEEEQYEEKLQREAQRVNLHQDTQFPSFRRKKVAFM